MGTSHLVTTWAARLVLRRKTRAAALAWLGRPFSSRARLRLAIHADINPITFAQVYPFFHEAAALWQRHGVELRLFPFQALVKALPCPADVALIAPWFDISPGDLSRALDHLGRVVPEDQISFIDSYAPNDLRLARHLLGRVRFYFKKSLFRDPARFCQVYRGTQLQDHYSRLYGLEEPWADWGVPEAILPHLRLSPGFQMAPHLMGQFRAAAPPQGARLHDLQVRIEVKGTPWYRAMRQDALDHAQALQGVVLTPPGRVSLWHHPFGKPRRNRRPSVSSSGFFRQAEAGPTYIWKPRHVCLRLPGCHRKANRSRRQGRGTPPA